MSRDMILRFQFVLEQQHCHFHSNNIREDSGIYYHFSICCFIQEHVFTRLWIMFFSGRKSFFIIYIPDLVVKHPIKNVGMLFSTWRLLRVTKA